MQEFFDNFLNDAGMFFSILWQKICELYMVYFDFVHSIFPDQMGDYIVGLINLSVAVLLVWLLARAAFRTKGN